MSANSITISTPVYSKSDAMRLTATASGGDTLTAVTSGDIVFSAGTATKLVVTLPGQTFTSGVGNSGTVTAQTAGTAFNLTLTAVDASNNTNVFYSGTKTISYSGPGGTPIYTTSVTFANGQATSVSTTLTKAEVTTITASDGTTAGPASSSLTVNAGAFTKLQLLVPGETAAPGTASGRTGTPTAQTAGTAFMVTVNAVDANWNMVSSTHTVRMTSSDGAATLPTDAALVAGTKTFSVTLNTAGSMTVTATDITDGSKTANTSPSITVYPTTVTTVTIPAATGRGNIILATNSPGCSFTNVQVFREDQTVVDPSYGYPYGQLGFTVNCSAADVSITFTGATDLTGLPYRKYGPTTPGDPSTTKWYTFNNVTVTGNTYILHLQDGVLGDDTPGGDHMIVGVGGPGQPQQAVPIPTLTEWGMLIMALLLAGVAGVELSRSVLKEG